ncbi:hypothetical protein JOF53_008450 [Crossiella equi]|uniref:Uncharacterized protein n=1 Tax=Crossiella equi TaxID=130796 RepID=A0ABS5ASN7_9PSEU|nr:hypothetical protein [Crossiella equi]MBP2479578.1 hypothetical protein [Crossiella equi]
MIDDFWNEISDGLDATPAFVALLRGYRPILPEEPTTKQLEPWIELANLLQDMTDFMPFAWLSAALNASASPRDGQCGGPRALAPPRTPAVSPGSGLVHSREHRAAERP